MTENFPNLFSKIDFGNEAADHMKPAEIKELIKYFVELDVFSSFQDPKKSFQIACAKKGVGKSALIQWLRHTLTKKEQNSIVISIKKHDLDFESLVSNPLTSSQTIAKWIQKISAIINREMAKELKFGINDDNISLIEMAECQGYRERSVWGTFLHRIKSIGGLQIEQEKSIANEFELMKRQKKNFVWLLIDDLDANFEATESSIRELSTFFTACCHMLSSVDDLRIRVTLRTDVWPILRNHDESLDKIEQYIQTIVWNQYDFRRFLAQRIRSQLIDILQNDKTFALSFPDNFKIDSDLEILNLVFEPTILWEDTKKTPYGAIHMLSYKRPRWAIQLCKLSQSYAKISNSTNINTECLEQVCPKFAQARLRDLAVEHKHQCPDVRRLFSAFQEAPTVMTRDWLVSHIKKTILADGNLVIEGKVNPTALEIAHFLYRIGFLSASSSKTNQNQYYYFDEMPDLLCFEGATDHNVEWNIHPCCRAAFKIIERDCAEQKLRVQRKNKMK